MKGSYTTTVAQLGNGCTKCRCSVQLPPNLRSWNHWWALKKRMSHVADLAQQF